MAVLKGVKCASIMQDRIVAIKGPIKIRRKLQAAALCVPEDRPWLQNSAPWLRRFDFNWTEVITDNSRIKHGIMEQAQKKRGGAQEVYMV